jgi:hypothetical protein
MNPWKLTRKGEAVDLVDPRPETISPADIAHSLSLQCRWGGHTREFYSVAQHSVHVAETAVLIAQTDGDYSAQEIDQIRLAAILHDAHEAYTGDIATPIKLLIGSTIMELEARLFAQYVAVPVACAGWRTGIASSAMRCSVTTTPRGQSIICWRCLICTSSACRARAHQSNVSVPFCPRTVASASASRCAEASMRTTAIGALGAGLRRW